MSDFSEPIHSNAAPPTSDSTSVFEGLSIRLAPAPILKRILAYLVDVAIISALFYALFFIGILFFAGLAGGLAAFTSFFKSGATDSMAAVGLISTLIILILAVLSVWHVYFIYFEYKRGATPGKKVMGLRVISLSQSRLSLSQAVFRDLFRYIDVGLLALPGLISMLVTAKKQRLGDLAAATLVVYSQESEAKQGFLYVSSEDYHALGASLAPRELDGLTCHTYLGFAYPYFVTGQANVSREQVERWVAYVSHFFTGTSTSAVSDELKLRFFAEHCLQTINQKKGGHRHG